MDVGCLLMSVLGTIIGCGVTVFVAIIVFWQSKKDFEEMNKKMRLILRGLEEGNIVEWTKDSKGEPKGVVIRLSAESGYYKVK